MNHRILGIATQVMVLAIIISIILLFMGIAVLVLIHICVIGRAIRRGFDNIAVEGNNSLNKGMSEDDLDKLPCFHYEPVAEKGFSDLCAVCLEGYQKGDRCRLLPDCKHSFHAQCVDAWLMKAPICPICRTGTKPPEVHNLEGGENHYDGDDLGSAQTVSVGILVSSDPPSAARNLLVSADIGSSPRNSAVEVPPVASIDCA